MITNETFKKRPDEEDWAYIYRVCCNHSVIGTWTDVAELINSELGRNSGESYYRYTFDSYNKIGNALSKQNGNSEYDEKIEQYLIVKEEAENAIVQMRDERNALNKAKRERARAKRTLDLIEENLSTIGKVQFPTDNNKIINQPNIKDNSLLICLSDLHIGAGGSEHHSKYSYEIAEQRLAQYLQNIIEIKERNNCEEATVALLGDLISGSIHKSLQVTNKENVINQVKMAGELIANFIYQLSEKFNFVTVIDVTGNHTRIDRKEDALNDERLDAIVSFIAETSTKHIPNIAFYNNDTNINTVRTMPIGNKMYAFVHGDYDHFNSSSVSKLSMWLGEIPYAVVFGHEHKPGFDDTSEVVMIRSGSLCGACDEFTERKRLKGKPSQSVVLLNGEGEVKGFFPITLD